MSHLRRYLEQTGAVSPEELETAMLRQKIYGGSLDTLLLELEIVDPLTLNEFLERACGLPTVPVELLENGLERPWDAVPTELLDIGWVLPLGRRDSEILAAVHPDLPDERLGALFRLVPGVRPMVTPECCLEKLAAERTSSVVPQRYAVLCVAFLSALRRRPSVSAQSYPLLSDDDFEGGFEGNTHPRYFVRQTAADEAFEDRPTQGLSTRPPKAAPTPAPPAASEAAAEGPAAGPGASPLGPSAPPGAGEYATGGAVDDVYAEGDPSFVPHPEAYDPDRAPSEDRPDTVVQDPGAPPAGVVVGDRGIPQFISRSSAAPLGEAESSELVPDGTIIPGAPPVRITATGTVISTPEAFRASIEQSQAPGLIAAKAALQSARDRDRATDALIDAALQISKRVVLFRIKNQELVAFSTPPSALGDIGGQVIPVSDGSDLAAAIGGQRPLTVATNAELRAVVGQSAAVPCLLETVQVRGRPILALYMDADGAALPPIDVATARELCRIAGETFEAVVKLRRAQRDPQKPAGPKIGPPPDFGTAGQPGWGPPSRDVAEAYGDLIHPPGDTQGIRTQAPPAVPPPPPPEDDLPGSLHLPTMTGPPVPPAPPSSKIPTDVPITAAPAAVTIDEAAPVARKPDNLAGLPPPTPSPGDSGPRFIPPPLDDSGQSEIISLSSPITQATARGRIDFADEDWSHPGQRLASESLEVRVDQVIDEVIEGDGEVDAIRRLGEPGLLRLASRFPGPLEVLRRDLRALPPPSAHGPLIRAAIRLASAFVPQLLELLHHPNPDVRFYAAFVFQELRDARCASRLAEMAFDPHGDVRVISMRVLETYSRSEGFGAAAMGVRDQLTSANRTRQLYAARAVGTLRDIRAIPTLIDLLSSKDRFIQEAALESLCSITGQQHGLKPHRWKAWFGEQGTQHRIEWIISSLRHRDLPVRRWAADELTRVTGHRIPLPDGGDKKSREGAMQAWRSWWEEGGRAQMAAREA